MYVGITRARTTLAVSTLRRRKKGRETVAGVPSRFIAEMKLNEAQQARIRAQADGAASGRRGAGKAREAGRPSRRRRAPAREPSLPARRSGALRSRSLGTRVRPSPPRQPRGSAACSWAAL